jgi:hypothetical protein
MALPFCELGVINFAVCWNICDILSPNKKCYSGKILKNRQSARNQIKNSLGSSEAIRKISFFKNYNGFQPSQIKDLDTNFLCWFIGFTEGDGSFCTNGKRNLFQIVQKDPKVLYYIKKN